MKTKFDLGLLSKYRDELFGLATISIIIYHFVMDYRGSDLYDAAGMTAKLFANGYYHTIGSIGVEVFLLLSGMGLFFAFSKDEKIGPFYKKRFLRIIPTYCLVGIAYYVVRDIVIKGNGIGAVIKHFTFYSFLTDGDVAMWFIFAILVFYLAYPLIYHVFKEKRHNVGMFLIVLIIVGLGLVLLHEFAYKFYDDTNIMTLRIVVFIIGCYLGQSIKEQRPVSMPIVGTFIIVTFILKVIVEYIDLGAFLWRHYNAIYCVGLVAFLCVLLKWMENMKVLRKFLCICGTLSLELYMTHTAFRWVFKNIGWHTSDIRSYAVVVMLSAVLSPIVHKFAIAVNNAVLKKC